MRVEQNVCQRPENRHPWSVTTASTGSSVAWVSVRTHFSTITDITAVNLESKPMGVTAAMAIRRKRARLLVRSSHRREHIGR